MDPDSLVAQPVPAHSPRRRLPLRWLVALLATLGVVLLIVGIFVLSSPPAPPALASVAPASSSFYLEVRMDLPGDQRDRLAAFLQHFPGFADQATMETKILDTFDQLLLNSTMGGLDWRNDIDPWFAGQAAVFAFDADSPESSLVYAMTVRDRSAAESLLQRIIPSTGGSIEYYRDAVVLSSQFGAGVVGITDQALLVGATSQAIREVIDVSAGDEANLADDEAFNTATGELRSDRVGLLYVQPAGVAGLLEQVGGLFLFGPAPSLAFDALAGGPAFVVELRIENDHLALTSMPQLEPAASLPPHAVNRAAGLVQLLPPDTLFYAEGREYGAQLTRQLGMLIELAGDLDQDVPLEELETFLGMPPEEFLDFLGDTAVSVSASGDVYTVGLVARVADEGMAIQRLERVSGALRAAAAIGAAPLLVEDQLVGEARLTVFRLTEQAGPGFELDVLPFSSMAYTVTDGLLLIGTDGFVQQALERDAADSLDAQPGYRAAIEAAGGEENAGGFYLDLQGLRGLFEESMPMSDRTNYDNEVRPFLAPFVALSGSTIVEGDVPVTRIVLLVE